ncbi:MAG: A24 family peptidase [Cellvibrionaceae bacterium]
MQPTINQVPFELIITFSIILGLLIGSFLNVVIHRLPIMLQNSWKSDCCELLEIKQSEEKNVSAPSTYNLLFPSSSCPNCKHKIRSWENIPVISYLFLKGKCSGCKNPISARYPIIEAVTGVLSGLIIYNFGATIEGGLLLMLVWSLIALTMIDIDTQLLPDNITLPLLWLGILVNSFEIFSSLEDAVYGAIAGYLSLWSVFWAFKILTKKEGMGYGDFKLLAAFGAWLGWQALPLIILLSSFVGAVIGIAGILILGRDKNIPIPFGPYLAIAGLIALFWGDQITQTYLQIANLN